MVMVMVAEKEVVKEMLSAVMLTNVLLVSVKVIVVMFWYGVDRSCAAVVVAEDVCLSKTKLIHLQRSLSVRGLRNSTFSNIVLINMLLEPAMAAVMMKLLTKTIVKKSK